MDPHCSRFPIVSFFFLISGFEISSMIQTHIYSSHSTCPTSRYTSSVWPKGFPIIWPMYSFLAIKGRSWILTQNRASVMVRWQTYCFPSNSLRRMRLSLKFQELSLIITLLLSILSSNSTISSLDPSLWNRIVFSCRRIFLIASLNASLLYGRLVCSLTSRQLFPLDTTSSRELKSMWIASCSKSVRMNHSHRLFAPASIVVILLRTWTKTGGTTST